ncbi:MAG: ribosome maturation factor RimM [Bacteroidales bacterium]|nr:ribosome maturation factor RimM [Bacteroidales bacterium]
MNCFSCKKAGYVKKTHGIKGELIIQLDYPITDNFYLKDWAYLNYEGMLIPFRIDYYEEVDSLHIIIKFYHIKNIEEAKRFVNCEFFVDNHMQWLQEYEKLNVKGYSLFDSNNELLGTIIDMLPIKNNPVVEVKKEKNKFLVPFHQSIIKYTDHNKKEVFLKLSKDELIA